MIFLLIAAGLCLLAAIIIFFSIPPNGGDGYMGQGLMAMFSFIASLVFLVLSVIPGCGSTCTGYNHQR